jgi:hypothetical protein
VQMWEMRYSHFLWFVKVGKTTLSADPKRNWSETTNTVGQMKIHFQFWRADVTLKVNQPFGKNQIFFRAIKRSHSWKCCFEQRFNWSRFWEIYPILESKLSVNAAYW